MQIDRVVCASVSAKQFFRFSDRVWDRSRWQRGAPKRSTVRAQRRQLGCMMGPRHLRHAKLEWRRDRRAFNRHRKRKIRQRKARKRRQAYLGRITPPGPGVLAAIRRCESGGRYSTNTGNGFYGAYQFTLQTWRSVGGSGYPHQASPREQDRRAAKLYRVSGSSPWPVCGV